MKARQLKIYVSVMISLIFSVSLSVSSYAQNGSVGSSLITSGMKYLGAPYEWGADPNQTGTFDCSSFTKRVFGENGIILPRTTKTQFQLGMDVSLNNAQIGDLVFFQDPLEPGIPGHVGIYAGNNKMLNATVSKGVRFVDITTSYWTSRFLGVKRVIPAVHNVKYGDTLWKISASNGIGIEQLKTWNGMNTDQLMSGQHLFIANPNLSSFSVTPAPVGTGSYLVRSGDSLWIVSQKTGVSIQDLKQWNSLSNDTIYVGQRLVTSAPAKPYTVAGGDTLWIISQKTGVSVQSIKSFNALESDVIYIGQVLTLPTA
jgi:LysM repeat protein